MKKLVMMLVCMFAVHTMVMADNDKPIEVSQLPCCDGTEMRYSEGRSFHVRSQHEKSASCQQGYL